MGVLEYLPESLTSGVAPTSCSGLAPTPKLGRHTQLNSGFMLDGLAGNLGRAEIGKPTTDNSHIDGAAGGSWSSTASSGCPVSASGGFWAALVAQAGR